MDNRKIILAVAYDDTTNRYHVDVGSGGSVAETAFAISIVIKCFLKDDIIKDASEVTNLVQKYLTDTQYNEVKDE